MEKITELRLQVDEIDEKIMALLSRRFQLSTEIQKRKQSLGLDSYDPLREEQILEKARSHAETVEEVYEELLRLSKEKA